MTAERERFLSALQEAAPDLNHSELTSLIVPELISGYVLELPKSVLNQAQDIVRAFFSLRKNSQYLSQLEAERKNLKLIDPGHYSIAMSYDFHVDASGNLRLVEINTNASFLALGKVMYDALDVPLPISDFSLAEIRANIENEMKLCGIVSDPPRVSIIDEVPAKQKLFAEFLFYQSLMRKWGWKCEIQDIAEVSPEVDFVYNRSTDFYLQSEQSKKLRELFLSKKACVSPNPYEYLCLADKNRMIDLSGQSQLPEILRSTLLKSYELKSQNSDEIWSQRKKYFFKPLRAFGGKQSYRGENISHRLFDELVGKGIVAQEFCPPSEVEYRGQKFKYDLRFFAYMDRVQLAVSRLYVGQLTNLKTMGGGFGTVKFA